MDIRLTDYDLDLAGGELSMVRGREAIAQHVTMRLRTWLGETIYDTTAGVPWTQVIFRSKNPDLLAAQLVIERVILDTPGVTGAAVSLDFDRPARTLAITGSIQSIDGEIDFSLEVTP